MVSPDDVADCVLERFDTLPAKGKPRPRDDGRREWIPLSGIVISSNDQALECVALGTGMKCLPRSKVPSANGLILHDWHAEILTIRAFNRYLVDEVARLASSPQSSSSILERRDVNELTYSDFQPYTVRKDVRIHMYCSEAPCGDASMELTMDAQEDATPWPVSDQEDATLGSAPELRGRGHFSELGIVRRKPARPDAPVTWSKSCSDKLALRQCTSLLNIFSSTLISPQYAYLTSLVVPLSQHNPIGAKRAFSASGRMAGAASEMGNASFKVLGYAFHPFEVSSTNREFIHSRRSALDGQKLVPCNISTMWIPHRQEVLINGVLQGRKQGDPHGASMLSRYRMWGRLEEVVRSLHIQRLGGVICADSYGHLKGDPASNRRRAVKAVVIKSALPGWKRNDGDDDFRSD